ncbi:hypothetical protein ACHAWF_004838, partial [Thalassiosira exigua]
MYAAIIPMHGRWWPIHSIGFLIAPSPSFVVALFPPLSPRDVSLTHRQLGSIGSVVPIDPPNPIDRRYQPGKDEARHVRSRAVPRRSRRGRDRQDRRSHGSWSRYAVSDSHPASPSDASTDAISHASTDAVPDSPRVGRHRKSSHDVSPHAVPARPPNAPWILVQFHRLLRVRATFSFSTSALPLNFEQIEQIEQVEQGWEEGWSGKKGGSSSWSGKKGGYSS